MENANVIEFGSHELKLIDRREIALTGIKKITSFDSEEFLLESNMGVILIKGSNLEIMKLDTHDGNVKIKGKINGFNYLDNKEKGKEESLFLSYLNNDCWVQLFTLSVSYLFSFLFYYLYKLNYIIIKNKKRFYQSLITILFMYNIVLIYIILIYKINNGIFHIYFFIMIILGFITNIKVTKKMLKNVKCRCLLKK